MTVKQSSNGGDEIIALGMRLGPKMVRYALVNYDGTSCKLLNSHSESRLTFPADVLETAKKADWLYREMKRVVYESPEIKAVYIKTNEYMLKDSKSKRETAYLEGSALLFCCQNSLTVETFVYTSLGTKNSSVKEDAQTLVGRTEKYWDDKIADAIMAARKGLCS